MYSILVIRPQSRTKIKSFKHLNFNPIFFFNIQLRNAFKPEGHHHRIKIKNLKYLGSENFNLFLAELYFMNLKCLVCVWSLGVHSLKTLQKQTQQNAQK